MKTALYNHQAERSVLGAILIDNDSAHRVGWLTPDDFDRDRHRVVYELIQGMVARSEPIDSLTIEDSLSARGLLERAGGPEYLSQLSDATPSAANIEHYARIVRERSARRRLLGKLREVANRIQIDDPLDEIAADVAASAEIGMINSAETTSLVATLDLLEKYQNGTEQGFLPIGLEPIDHYAPSTDELVIVAGRPSVGKTAFAIDLSERIARNAGPVLFVSIEMSGDGINFRRLASSTGITVSSLKRHGGIDTDGQWSRVMNAFDSMKRSSFHVVSGGFTPAQLEATIRAEHARLGLRAVVIDHLGLLRYDRVERRDLEIGKCTAALARLTKDLGVCVFLLAQLNRCVETRGTQEPKVADLRDSGRIEEDADAVWLLYREGLYRADAGDEFQVIIGKNRNGPVGRAHLRFDETTGRFME